MNMNMNYIYIQSQAVITVSILLCACRVVGLLLDLFMPGPHKPITLELQEIPNNSVLDY